MSERVRLEYESAGPARVLMEREGEDVRFVIPTVGAAGRVVAAVLSAVVFAAMGLALVAGGDGCGWAAAGFMGLCAGALGMRAARCWVERKRPMMVEAGPGGLSIVAPRGWKTDERSFAAGEVKQAWVGPLDWQVDGKPMWYLHVACAGRHYRVVFAGEGAENMEAELRLAMKLEETEARAPVGSGFELIESTVEVYLPDERG